MKKIYLLLTAISIIGTQANAIDTKKLDPLNLFSSKEFKDRDGQHCTGYCESGNLRCPTYPQDLNANPNVQGSYAWCEKNCTHDTKTNRNAFTAAISQCKTQWEASKPVATKAGEKVGNGLQAVKEQSKGFFNGVKNVLNGNGKSDPQSQVSPSQNDTQSNANGFNDAASRLNQKVQGISKPTSPVKPITSPAQQSTDQKKSSGFMSKVFGNQDSDKGWESVKKQ